MSSELSVGHHHVGGGDALTEPKTVPGGLLGADYEVANGRYRFKKVYGGLNWNPQLRAPLTAPGVEREGGRVPARGRRQRRCGRRPSVYCLFENTAGKIVEITRRARTPTAPARARCRSSRSPTKARCGTATGSRATCGRSTKATGGRVAYVYVPNTGELGPRLLQAVLLPAGRQGRDHRRRAVQRRRQVADYYIDILRRPFIALLGDALRRRPQDAERGDPRAEGDDHRRDRGLGRRPAAVDVPQVQARARSSASGPGAGWSASSASRR